MTMEKLGVSNEELIAELRKRYTELKERSQGTLTKEASFQVQTEIEIIKAKLDELQGH